MRSLVQNEILQEFEISLTQAFISQVGVLGQDIRRQIVVLVLAVQQDQVREGFRWEWWIRQQKVKLLETCRSVLLNVHQRGVVESDRI